MSIRLFGAEAEGRRLARSYDNENWSLFRAFMWINEQTYHSIYTFLRYCLRERRHPSNLAMFLKVKKLNQKGSSVLSGQNTVKTDKAR